MEKVQRLRELTSLLIDASKEYYTYSREIMSNQEFDKLYDELVLLEKETGVTMANSPTQTIYGELLPELKKVKHTKSMLSADKTKDVNKLKSWIGEQEGLLSWKLDGLTIVITYINGHYNQAVTRGGGVIGEDITHSIRTCINLPLKIPYTGELVIRGECTISYSNFEKINNTIQDIDSRYKNPRNLASGSVRQLDSKVAAQRYLEFKAFSVVKCVWMPTKKDLQFETLKSWGIDTVEYKKVDKNIVLRSVEDFNPENYNNPVDGLILEFNDTTYGDSLGETSKFTLNMIALKWEDDLSETIFRGVKLKTSRYGVASITAFFNPVEIEGSTVSKASLHNVDIFRALQLGIGDRVQVYKANMIIPQIAENIDRSGTYELPMICPSCGSKLEIRKDVDTNELHCDNDNCKSKLIQRLSHFVSKDAMNIDDCGESTLEKLIEVGLVNTLEDIYHLEDHKNTIIKLEGFGKKSYDKLIDNINKSRTVSFENLIYALGVKNIGKDVSKKINKQCDGRLIDFKFLINNRFNWEQLDGIGNIINQSIQDYFCNADNFETFMKLIEQLEIETPNVVVENTGSKPLEGKSICITGKLIKYANRDALVKDISLHGGKVVVGVTKLTSYLLTNDVSSGTSKNAKARELSIPIISEDQFLEMIK